MNEHHRYQKTQQAIKTYSMPTSILQMPHDAPPHHPPITRHRAGLGLGPSADQGATPVLPSWHAVTVLALTMTALLAWSAAIASAVSADISRRNACAGWLSGTSSSGGNGAGGGANAGNPPGGGGSKTTAPAFSFAFGLDAFLAMVLWALLGVLMLGAAAAVLACGPIPHAVGTGREVEEGIWHYKEV